MMNFINLEKIIFLPFTYFLNFRGDTMKKAKAWIFMVSLIVLINGIVLGADPGKSYSYIDYQYKVH